jgi:hypothetical protein
MNPAIGEIFQKKSGRSRSTGFCRASMAVSILDEELKRLYDAPGKKRRSLVSGMHGKTDALLQRGRRTR